MNKRFYKRPWFYIPAIVLGIPALLLAWWLGSPLFLDKTVIEEFPGAAPAAASSETTAQPTPQTAPQVEPAAAAPTSANPEQSSTSPPSSLETLTVPSSEPPARSTTVAPGPFLVLSGEFKDADSRHRGSGTATIYRLEDESLVLRVENLDVTNGPDLHVILAPVQDAQSRSDVHAEGYLDLGELKGNKGDQNYPIDGDIDLTKQWTVVIYCVPFHVVFSTAPLV